MAPNGMGRQKQIWKKKMQYTQEARWRLIRWTMADYIEIKLHEKNV